MAVRTEDSGEAFVLLILAGGTVRLGPYVESEAMKLAKDLRQEVERTLRAVTR